MQLHLRKKAFLPRGFILIQCICGIALIGGICFLSFSFYTVYERSCVRHELDRLYAVMRYMQRKAVIENKELSLTFDPKKNRYHAGEWYALPAGVRFGAKGGVCGPPSHPVCPIHEGSAIVWPENRMTYYPDGTIAAGAVYLASAQHSCTYALTCDASEATHIRRYRHDGTWKNLGALRLENISVSYE